MNTQNSSFTTAYDLLCFTHLRWDFVYQRPQHLMSRFARDHRVFIIEEPIFGRDEPSVRVMEKAPNLFIVIPHIPTGLSESSVRDLQRALLEDVIGDFEIGDYVSWYYTPMMFAWSGDLSPRAVVYDCMDELSAFKFAPPELHQREKELFARADLVFTGGQSLYEAKKEQHRAVYAYPQASTRNISRRR